jgi:hypothetical protein
MRQLTPRQLDALRGLSEGALASEYPTVTIRSLERASYVEREGIYWRLTEKGTRALGWYAARDAARSRSYEASFRSLMMKARDLP